MTPDEAVEESSPAAETVDTPGQAAPDVSAPGPAGKTRSLPALGSAPGPLLPGDPFSRAGRKAMWPHVERLLAREAALRDPSATDALKRYRVATRRLRAAIRVFRDAYPGRETKALRLELAHLAMAVGAVRDLDVRIAGLEAWSATIDPPVTEFVEPLRVAWAEQRTTAAASLARHLDTKRHARLLRALSAFVTVDDAPASSGGPPDRLVRDRAASAIWSAYELVRAYAPVIRQADLATLHRLRIETKRLRYTLEFLGEVLGPERPWLIARLVDLQDHLGSLNDAAIAAVATRTFLGDGEAALAAGERAAIEQYLGDREREVGRVRRSLGRVWRPVVGVTFTRRLGRAVAIRTTQ